jgi:Alpha/beta hydrolase family
MRITWWWCVAICLGLGLGCSTVDPGTNPGGVGGQTGLGLGGNTAAGASGSSSNAMAGRASAGMNGGAGMSTGMSGMGSMAGTTGASGMGAAGATAGAGGAAMAGAGGMAGSGGPSGNYPPAMSVDADGPFKPTHIQNGGMSGSSWVFYPMELGMNGMKHPIFNWGPGAGTGPSQYTDHLNRLASHGFVVISQPSSGSGGTEKASLDWLIAQNDKMDSPFFQKLDTKKVGAGGHSLGALTTMAMAADPRLTLYVLVCGGCMSGNGGCGAADIHAPTVILGGDTDIGTPNFMGDYDEIKSPVAFVIKDGTDHIACARNNLAPWVAFMRWQFYGEEKYKPDFLTGAYCKTPWKCMNKGIM